MRCCRDGEGSFAATNSGLPASRGLSFPAATRRKTRCARGRSVGSVRRRVRGARTGSHPRTHYRDSKQASTMSHIPTGRLRTLKVPAVTVSTRTREMIAEWEELWAEQPGAQESRDREHTRRMLAEGWPLPQAEQLCHTCLWARGEPARRPARPACTPAEAPGGAEAAVPGQPAAAPARGRGPGRRSASPASPAGRGCGSAAWCSTRLDTIDGCRPG